MRICKARSFAPYGSFSGFKPPVDNPPVVNIVKAGSTVPVKWSLQDSAGNYIRSLSTVTSISSTAIKCAAAATDPDPDTVASGLAGLKYDTSAEQFIFNWQTQKSWSGTCRRFTLGLVGNGVLQYADFHTLFPYTTLFRFRSEERRVGKECNSSERRDVA